MSFINHFLSSYGFESVKDFYQSLCPSFKYGLQHFSLAISAILALISEAVGITPVIVVAMFVIVVVEVLTGTKASRKCGIPFESFRFSRCVLKVFIWLCILFIFNSFSMGLALHHESSWIHRAGVVVFDMLGVTTMLFFCIEYTTSILENLAVLDGKPKEALVVAMGELFQSIVSRFKSHRHDKDI